MGGSGGLLEPEIENETVFVQVCVCVCVTFQCGCVRVGGEWEERKTNRMIQPPNLSGPCGALSGWDFSPSSPLKVPQVLPEITAESHIPGAGFPCEVALWGTFSTAATERCVFV